MERNFLPGTQIEIINENIVRGRIKHALFDFDGTFSLMREGWEKIMAPVMIESICGDTEPTQAIIDEVNRVIDETTGIQTIFQMERLVEIVRAHGLVAEDKILDAPGYKAIYNERLMLPVRDRIARVQSGALSLDDVLVHGSLDFVRVLKESGIQLYVFSGTDRDDVRNEAAVVGAAPFFNEIWGALPSKEEYSKEKVIREIMAAHDLHGPEVMAVGDGPVELKNIKSAGGIAVGVASDEVKGEGWNDHKRNRLLNAGADILVPDFLEYQKLADYLLKA
jgi:phosphoglycolate phosphatase-like HAD superfamily hydrolase